MRSPVGTPVAAPRGAISPPRPATRKGVGADRRAATIKVRCAILFADICDSVAVYTELGDEQALVKVQACLGWCAQACAWFSGIEIKRTGDGLMAALPSADAAFRAAMRMTGAPRPDLLPVRIGVHFGPILVVGADAYGQTINLASRIMEMAEPGEVVVTEPTAIRLSPGFADLLDAGEDVEIRGFPDRLKLFRAQALAR